ncbi:MAG: hypothetical protein BACD_02894 [Bacteroides rodentium]
MSESFMQKRHEKTGPQRTIVLQGPIFILPSLHRFQPYTHPASPYQLPLRRPHTYNTINLTNFKPLVTPDFAEKFRIQDCVRWCKTLSISNKLETHRYTFSV